MRQSSEKLAADFKAYDEANPHVYGLLERLTMEAIAAGMSKIGISMVYERMRWYAAVETSRTSRHDFKFANDYKPYYARKFIALNPQHKNIFNIRPSLADDYRFEGKRIVAKRDYRGLKNIMINGGGNVRG